MVGGTFLIALFLTYLNVCTNEGEDLGKCMLRGSGDILKILNRYTFALIHSIVLVLLL